MVYVRLAKDWTDPAGAAHEAGEMVDVDAATLAELEASGVVTESNPTPAGGWPGPSGGGGTSANWTNPTGGGTEGGWPGPSGSDDS